MDNDTLRFLNRRRLSARLYAEEVAVYLGLKPHDLGIPAVRRLLPPLCEEQGTVKYWATVNVEAAWRNRTLLARITRAINEHWHHHNHGEPPADEITFAA